MRQMYLWILFIVWFSLFCSKNTSSDDSICTFINLDDKNDQLSLHMRLTIQEVPNNSNLSGRSSHKL